MEGSEPRPRDFSRGDLDRVIRRAVELQHDDGGEPEGAPRLDEAEIRRIGAEVGLEDRFLRRAIDEIRAEQLLPTLSDDSALAARLVGERRVRAHRVVPGSVDELEPRLGEHLEVAETLSSVRSRGGRSLWEPSRGPFVGLRRGMRWRGYRYELARISSLDVALFPMEKGFVLVDLIADLGRPRTEMLLGGTLGGGVAGTGVGVGVGIGMGLPLLGIPGAVVGVLTGVRLARAPFRRRVDRVRLTMEGILDRLEAGAPLARKSLPGPWGDRLRGQ